MSVRITVVYAALMAALGVGLFVLPGSTAPVWLAVGTLSVAAIVAGMWLHRPARRLPWLLLAGAVLAMAFGDTVYAAAAGRRGLSPAPMWSDVAYLVMFPLLVAGLIVLTRASVVLRDRSRRLDLLTFASGVVLVAWVVAGGPATRAPGLSAEDRWTTFAYLVGDLLMVLTTARLVVAARRSPAVVLLAVGALGSLAADLGYLEGQLAGSWTSGSPAEVGYLVFYAAWGLAALQPSMVELTAPVPVPMRWAAPQRRSVVLLASSLAIPPVVLLVESAVRGNRDGMLIAAASAVTFGLAVLRLADALAGYRGAVARERSLREACGALVAAADAGQVDAGVRRAMGTIMPPGVPYGVVFVLDGGPLPAPGPGRRTRLLAAAELDGELLAALGPHPAALVCPLELDRRPAGDPRTGALLVAADPRVLVASQDAVEVLVAQAALAAERIALTAAAERRDRDEYLQAVVSHTSDVVLIVDEDGRVRYASPSLRTTLGLRLPLFATVRDVVAPEDHALVAEAFTRAALEGPEGLRVLCNVQRPGGRRVLVRASFRDLRADRMVGGFVVTMREVTGQDEERLSADEVQFLPGGWNRRSSTDKFR